MSNETATNSGNMASGGGNVDKLGVKPGAAFCRSERVH